MWDLTSFLFGLLWGTVFTVCVVVVLPPYLKWEKPSELYALVTLTVVTGISTALFYLLETKPLAYIFGFPAALCLTVMTLYYKKVRK